VRESERERETEKYARVLGAYESRDLEMNREGAA
jgi:hypothetical protein